ncbi:MAG: Gfo/Idh/MocA family oxidoreductase, partial [Planctomycetes bacterium]|nr:Gfo/Idh/MocA family oxidoreductase [Planctomycetota bacterium]
MSERARSGNCQRSTRRDFLKRSAAVASLTAVSPWSIARGAFAGGTGTIKIGMIGCGGRCTGAAGQALRSGRDVKLVAMCDIFEDRLENSRKALLKSAGEDGSGGQKGGFRDQIDVPPERRFVGFDGYKKVIECSDAVLIACASKFHPMYAEAAIQAGKHVFVEKPHGIDPVGVRRMEAVCKLAKEKGLSIVSGLHSRFHTGWQETIKRIHDGIIGQVTSIQSMFLRGPYRLVKRDPKLTETQYQFSNWYHFLWLSGDD